MRSIAITFCLLSVLFVGGCALWAISTDNWNDIIMTRLGVVLAVTLVANLVFVWMIWRHVGGWPLMVLGVIYIAAQTALVWRVGLWGDFGGFIALPFALVVLKGLAVVVAGWDERTGRQ